MVLQAAPAGELSVDGGSVPIDHDQLLEYMIEREVLAIFYNSVEKIADYFETRFGLAWPKTRNKVALVEASLLRNCIIHNGSRVDRRLADFTNRRESDLISLDPSDVHFFGLEARSFAHDIYAPATKKHLQQTKHRRQTKRMK